SFLKRWLEKLPSIVSHGYLILVVLIGWVFFELVDMSQAVSYLGAMFGMGASGAANSQSWYLLKENALFFIVASLFSTPLMGRLKKRLPEGVKYLVYTVMLLLCIAYLVDATFNPFLYFRF
ncbi:MAG: MBOAT family protein, partial [Acetivibrio ethanolgignens]